MTAVDVTTMRRFRTAYAEQRAAEGRAYTHDELLALPYIERGPLARQWAVRSRTFDAFMQRIMTPLIAASPTAPRVIDLGAGNAWLSHRLANAGCSAIAVDLRDDDIDGLGAAEGYVALGAAAFGRIVGSFESIPLADASADVVVFNASLHYAMDLAATLREARRVLRPSGRIVVLDSPFYAQAADGDAMVREKRASAVARFGANAGALLALPCIEYLTADGLASISAPLGIRFTRHRVRYPLWYETRALRARVRRQRVPSRFDMWEGIVA